MNYVQGIEDLFDYLEKQINVIIDYLNIDDLKNLFIYLYNCIPEAIRGVFLLVILLFILVGFVKAFRH